MLSSGHVIILFSPKIYARDLLGLKTFRGQGTLCGLVSIFIVKFRLNNKILPPAVIYRSVVDGGGLPQSEPHGVRPEHEERENHHSAAAQGPLRAGCVPRL